VLGLFPLLCTMASSLLLVLRIAMRDSGAAWFVGAMVVCFALCWVVRPLWYGAQTNATTADGQRGPVTRVLWSDRPVVAGPGRVSDIGVEQDVRGGASEGLRCSEHHRTGLRAHGGLGEVGGVVGPCV